MNVRFSYENCARVVVSYSQLKLKVVDPLGLSFSLADDS